MNVAIHTRFPFQIASSRAANKKSSGFCVLRFQTDFDEREHFVLSSLHRNIAFIVICAPRTRDPGRGATRGGGGQRGQMTPPRPEMSEGARFGDGARFGGGARFDINHVF